MKQVILGGWIKIGVSGYLAYSEIKREAMHFNTKKEAFNWVNIPYMNREKHYRRLAK